MSNTHSLEFMKTVAKHDVLILVLGRDFLVFSTHFHTEIITDRQYVDSRYFVKLSRKERLPDLTGGEVKGIHLEACKISNYTHFKSRHLQVHCVRKRRCGSKRMDLLISQFYKCQFKPAL